jgi:hypothetical protein
MPSGLWQLFDRLVGYFPSATSARSHGEALGYLLRQEHLGGAEWLDWEQEKQRRLIQGTERQHN